jgi:thymidylate kinase
MGASASADLVFASRLSENSVATPAQPILNLHRALTAGGVRYCHFKSNAHLAAGMAGETDLDVLLDSQQRQEAERCLVASGFKAFRAIGHLAYPGVIDYLAMDENSGALVHLHIHYQLILGEKHLKGYRIPWESSILASRTLDGEHGFFTASVAWELLLLLLRASLKVRVRDHISGVLGMSAIEPGIAHEFAWLTQRCERTAFAELAQHHVGPRGLAAANALLERGLSLRRLARFRRAVSPMLREWRTHSPLRAWFSRHIHEAAWLIGGLSRRFLNRGAPTKRIPINGGRVIALLGCDGSGKSTLGKELRRWLAWKLDVYAIYHGSGDGESSLLRWPLKAAQRLFVRSRKKSPDSSGGTASARRESVAKRIIRPIWAIALACEKTRKLRRQTRARNLGMVVLADRYPQTEVAGIHDGPLLDNWAQHPNRLLRWLSRWERRRYERFALFPPDLVLKLNVDVEECWRRKPEGSRENLQRRVEAIARIHVPALVEEVLVDASLPKDLVALSAKRQIWKLL